MRWTTDLQVLCVPLPPDKRLAYLDAICTLATAVDNLSPAVGVSSETRTGGNEAPAHEDSPLSVARVTYPRAQGEIK